jgi:hypothetical protein
LTTFQDEGIATGWFLATVATAPHLSVTDTVPSSTSVLNDRRRADLTNPQLVGVSYKLLGKVAVPEADPPAGTARRRPVDR